MPAHRTLAVPAAALALCTLTVTGIAHAGTTDAAATSTAATSTAATASAPAAVCAPDYSPVPENWSTEKGGLEIGYLTKVVSSGGVVKVRIDRVSFYRGAEAEALNGGVPPIGDHLLTDTDSRQRTYVLDPKASLQAEYELRNDVAGGTGEGEVGRQALTRGEFVRNARTALADGSRPLVWLRHTDGMRGPVTALAEQYTP